MKYDPIGDAIDFAVARFGDEQDGLFNSDNFRNAVRLAASQSLEDDIVKMILFSRPDITYLGENRWRSIRHEPWWRRWLLTAPEYDRI